MEEIRRLDPEETRDYVGLLANAFPVMQLTSPEKKEDTWRRIVRSYEEGVSAGAFGCFRDGVLVGGMRLHDFEMSLFGRPVLFGGLGGVAVHLAHKKEKVAKSMVRYFLEHYDAKGAPLAGLYAFRPDFYKNMGFGFGAKTKQYRLPPARLPKGPSKGNVRLLRNGEQQLVVDYCRDSMMARHGCVRLNAPDLEKLFDKGENIAAAFRGGKLAGYLRFSMKPYIKEKYAMHVTEFFYDDRDALSELLTFLHTQADQFETVLIDTGDEYFHFLCENPSNGDGFVMLHHQTNAEELGVLYRVLSVRRFFETMGAHDFGGVTACVRLNIRDGFLPQNDGSVTVRFTEGRAAPAEGAPYDFEAEMDISEFTSMAMGVVPFSALYAYSKAGISDERFAALMDGIFFTGKKPYCNIKF